MIGVVLAILVGVSMTEIIALLSGNPWASTISAGVMINPAVYLLMALEKKDSLRDKMKNFEKKEGL